MNKKETLQSMWIPINARVPPDSIEIILCWLPLYNKVVTRRARTARMDAERMMSPDWIDSEIDLSWDRRFSHWMPIYSPSGRKMFKE